MKCPKTGVSLPSCLATSNSFLRFTSIRFMLSILYNSFNGANGSASKLSSQLCESSLDFGLRSLIMSESATLMSDCVIAFCCSKCPTTLFALSERIFRHRAIQSLALPQPGSSCSYTTNTILLWPHSLDAT